MSEPEKPKRKFWRFHLSTAVVLMLVAGAFIGSNFQFTIYRSPQFINLANYERGWPMTIESGVGYGFTNNPSMQWHVWSLCVNASVMVAALLSVAVTCEWWIRRRENRKP